MKLTKKTYISSLEAWKLELNFNVESQTSYDLTPTQANKLGGRKGGIHAIDQQAKLGARKEML
jgi:hypothetical protein